MYVAKNVGQDIVDHCFVVLGTFTTRDAALASATAFGKRKVDEGLVDPEIASIIEQQTRLPSTHRHGYGSRTDDVAEGADGLPTKIPTSGNPDDPFN